MTDYMNHLFSYVPPERLGTFSYGHVIPSTNLVAQSLTKGLLGSEFDFTYEARGSEKMVSGLGITRLAAHLFGPISDHHDIDYRSWADDSHPMSSYTRWRCRIFPQLRLPEPSG